MPGLGSFYVAKFAAFQSLSVPRNLRTALFAGVTPPEEWHVVESGTSSSVRISIHTDM
jgi:hypothetical protein